MLKNTKLLLFDLDGTLVDSAPDIAASANYTLEHYGWPTLTQTEIKKLVGNGIRTLLYRLAPDRFSDESFLDEVVEVFRGHYGKNLLNFTRYYPGAVNVINQWDGPVGIVTNKSERFARQIIQGLEIPESRFCDIIGGDRFKEKKPHPVQILHAIRTAQVSPAQTVMIGDSVQDVQAAAAAGTQMVAVTFGYNPVSDLKEAGAIKFIDHFDHLLDLIIPCSRP